MNKITPPGKEGENFRYLRFEKINPQDLPDDKRVKLKPVNETFEVVIKEARP